MSLVRFRRRVSSAAASVALLAVMLGGASALAYWIALGTGSAVAAVGSLLPPTSVVATLPSAAARTVHVAWANQPAPDGGSDTGSYVERLAGSTWSPACGSSPAALLGPSVTACDDTSLASGTYQYRVTAVFRSWTAVSPTSGPVTVPAAALSSLAVAPATGTPTAGVPFNVVVTAFDQYGAVFTAYTGAQCLTFSGPRSSSGGTAPTYPVRGACAAGSGVTFAAGVATVSVTLTAAETVALRATDNPTGATGVSANLVVAPASATKLGFTVQPSNALQNTAFTNQPAVAVQDSFGNTVTTNTSSVTLAITSGSGTSGAVLTCTSNPLAATAGVAPFAGCRINLAGSGYTLTATDGALTAATSTAFTISSGTPKTVAISSGSPQSATVASSFGAPLVVLVTDSGGNPLPGAAVTFTAPTSGASGTFSGGALSVVVAADNNGRATSPAFTANTAVGSYTVSASANGTNTVSFSLSNTPGAAAKLAVTTSPSASTVAGSAFASQPVVKVQDTYGNTVTSDTSSVTLAVSGGGATIACTANPLAASAGVAAFAGCKVTTAGTWTLTATDGALTAATSATFVITPGAATKLAVSSGTPQSTTVATAYVNPLVALVTDAYGNPVPGVIVTFTADQAQVAGGSFLGGSFTATVTSNAAGLASAPTLTADTIAGSYTVTATAVGSLSAVFVLSNMAGPATQLAFAQAPGNASPGVAFLSQPVVALQDTYGNLATSSSGTVSLVITAGTGTSGAVLSCAANSVATASGLATFAGCSVNLAGSGYTLTATGPFAAVVSAPFTVTTALTPTSLALVNAGTRGAIDTGDSIAIFYSATVKASTFCSDWTSDSTAYSVTDGIMAIGNNTAASGFDQLTFSTATSCGGVFNLGTIDVGTNKLTTANARYQVTFAWDPSLHRMTVTIGSPITATTGRSFKGNATVTYSPSATITDPLGGVIVGTSTFIGRVF